MARLAIFHWLPLDLLVNQRGRGYADIHGNKHVRVACMVPYNLLGRLDFVIPTENYWSGSHKAVNGTLEIDTNGSELLDKVEVMSI